MHKAIGISRQECRSKSPSPELQALRGSLKIAKGDDAGGMKDLNEVRQNTPSSDLPKAASPVDHIFIVILACADREAALDWYRDRIKLDIGGSYTIEYTMINKAFGLPDGHQSTITMAQKARLPIIEVDGYPQAATVRPGPADALPAGNAIVTLAVDSLDALALDWITPPAVRNGPLYANRRAATVRGPAGELLELVEIGS